jgi:hypothetical protein
MTKKKWLLASPCPSVRMKQLGSHETDFHEIGFACPSVRMKQLGSHGTNFHEIGFVMSVRPYETTRFPRNGFSLNWLHVRPSVWNNSVPTERLFMKFEYFGTFFPNLSRKFNFLQNTTRIPVIIREDLRTHIISRWIFLEWEMLHIVRFYGTYVNLISLTPIRKTRGFYCDSFHENHNRSTALCSDLATQFHQTRRCMWKKRDRKESGPFSKTLVSLRSYSINSQSLRDFYAYLV